MLLVTQRVSESTVILATKLKIRCPVCTKLYEVESEDIRSEMPLFGCISCDSRFSFEYPPTDPQNVECFVVPTDISKTVSETAKSGSTVAKRQESVLESAAEPVLNEMKACPKCGALNGRRTKECYSCHVIFEKLEGLPKDPTLKAQPSLVRKWKNLLHNFENNDLHDEFIRSCHQLDALKFANLKYEELKSAQGGDIKCDQMIAKIHSLMVVGLQQNTPSKASTTGAKSKWQKYFYWGPFGVSFLLILLGMINLGHRNLIGVGVALGFMSAGLIIMIRGKLSAADFFE